MRRQTVTLLLPTVFLLAAPAARAQPAGAQPPMMPGGGGGKMPDLSRIVGRPLPDAGMPTGTVSVRVARQRPANAVANLEVSAIIKNAGGDLRRRALKTDDSGRVLFEGMAPGDQFHAEVTVDGERLKTETFTMPPTGGLRTMLISGLAAGSGSEGGEPAAPGRPGARDQRTFALGATTGNVEPDASLPAGTLDVFLRDENQAPIPNYPAILGMVKQGDIEVKNGKSDAAGKIRFTDLAAGEQTAYAVVIDWRGLRLNTPPFAMPEGGGVRAEIRALVRTSDPSVISIGEGGRIVLQMREDSLQILEFLPLENTSDKLFDPGPGAFEIPLPSGFTGAQPQENERKVEVRQDHGIAVHGAIVPKRMQLIAPDNDRRDQEVVFGFVLPYRGDTHVFKQPAPNGIGLTTVIVDQKIAGLTVSGAGVGERMERTLGGRKYWVMPVAAVAAGGALTFTISGLPSNSSVQRTVSGVLSLLMLLATFAFARRPQSGAAGKRKPVAEERARLIEKRETLFAELVQLERAARAAGRPAPPELRGQLVSRLEQIYQDIAALDEPRAA
jgi:hypothetical protein